MEEEKDPRSAIRSLELVLLSSSTKRRISKLNSVRDQINNDG